MSAVRIPSGELAGPGSSSKRKAPERAKAKGSGLTLATNSSSDVSDDGPPLPQTVLTNGHGSGALGSGGGSSGGGGGLHSSTGAVLDRRDSSHLSAVHSQRTAELLRLGVLMAVTMTIHNLPEGGPRGGAAAAAGHCAAGC